MHGRSAKLALLAAILLVIFLREPGCLIHPEFWAEDGSVFYRQQLVYGPAADLLTSAGYWLLMPRVLTLVTVQFPPIFAPLLFAIESILITGACCWAFCLDVFRPVLRSDLLRACLCLLAAVSLPSEELIGNITNIQWFLLFVAVPLTRLPRVSRSAAGNAGLFVLGSLIALSAPLTIVLLPVILIGAIRERRLDSFSMAIAAGTITEWAIIATHWSTRAAAPGGLLAAGGHLIFTTIVAVTNQVVMFTLLGRGAVKTVWTKDEWGLSVVVLVVFTYAVLALYRTGSSEYKARTRLMMWLILSSTVLAMLRGMESVYTKVSSVQPFGGQRYFLLACWCVVFLALSAILDRTPNWSDLHRTSLAGALFLLATIANFKVAGHFTADWSTYSAQVQAWEADRRAGREHGEVIAPISPRGWVVDLPKLVPNSSPK